MNRNNSCKCGFKIICVLCTIGMVGFWLYKYGEEDRDIGVVDYESFEKESDIPFPVVTFCFRNIFIPKHFSTDSHHIDVSYDYGSGYLEDEIYNATYENLD